MKIPVLSVRQPWASLIINGGKDIENRDWPTRVRGRVGIHSSARMTREEMESACDFMASWIPKFSSHRFKQDRFPLGYILGTVEIADCVRQSDSPWFMGEYGFVLRNPLPLPTPIVAKGALGFWTFDLPEAANA